jgi:uncharacterized paraquat-inducible protein A
MTSFNGLIVVTTSHYLNEKVNGIRLTMHSMSKQRSSSARLAKVTLLCPRCGQKKRVTAIETEHLILCPRCGAGMREIDMAL